MAPLKKIYIKNFRAIDYLECELNKLNIFVGRNNTGKTSVLEAISLLLLSFNNFNDIFNNNIIKIINDNRGGLKYLKNVLSRYAVIKGLLNSNKTISLYIFNDVDEIRGLKDNKLVDAVNKTIKLTAIKRYEEKKRELEEEIEQLKRKLDVLPEDSPRRISYERRIKILLDKLQRLRLEKDKIIMDYGDKIQEDINMIAVSMVNDNVASVNLFHDTYRRHSNVFYEDVKGVLGDKSISVSVDIVRRRLEGNVLDRLEVDKLINLIDKLKEIVPHFYDYRNGMVIFKYNGLKEIVPLHSVGDGFLATLEIIVPILYGANIIIVEEPEQHMHPGLLEKLSAEIINAVKRYDVQYIMTTHSIEFLENILVYAKDNGDLDKVNIIRLYRVSKGRIDYEVLNGEEAFEELDELKGDLRGP